tara:strand:+ start:81939 stop:82127 length:189 start_codon:yes stop_codon:yes gene_type:complete
VNNNQRTKGLQKFNDLARFIKASDPTRGVAEWSNAAVLKTVVPRGTGGSNPSSSAPNSLAYC